jgi:hypothetical protein
MAASITFEVLDVAGITGSGLNGSGLGFYGSGGFGTSVPLLAYQKRTFLTNTDGTANGGETRNTEFISGIWGSSGVRLFNDPTDTGMLVKMNNTEVPLMIHFKNDTKVLVQNCQLRIYDRTTIDNPATGVVTKVAEIVNFNGSSYNSWKTTGTGGDFTTTVGSGDAFWWGAPWPDAALYNGANVRPYYQNSVGVQFPNFTSSMDNNGSGNPDSKLVGLSWPGKQTVGGTGLIVPLLDSPGSGGQCLATGFLYPKFCQYVNSTYQGSTYLGMATPRISGDAGVMAMTYGGTSGDYMHTWRVAISASPLNIGSKTAYGMYISLEYL